MLEPSFVANTTDVPGPDYKMWQTYSAPAGATVNTLAEYLGEAMRTSYEYFGSKLLNIVVNSHGGPGAIYFGGLGSSPIMKADLPALAFLKKGGGAGTIWLVACDAATGSSGMDLCQTLAVTTGYQVVAAAATQDVGFWGAWNVSVVRNTIDEFEGEVYGFYAGGTSRKIDPHDDIFTIYD
jgi:Domain of unknown function (DUF4347)